MFALTEQFQLQLAVRFLKISRMKQTFEGITIERTQVTLSALALIDLNTESDSNEMTEMTHNLNI
jgi:hypothetical protein